MPAEPEPRARRHAGDNRLTGSQDLWLRRPQDMSPEQRQAFRAPPRQDLRVARAWTLKERFRAFWDHWYPWAAV